MLQNLTIKNFVIIDNLSVDFTSGLCVLSGETGAGKSILLDALGFLLGNRANSRYLKNKDNAAIVNAIFDISSSDALKEYLKSLDIICDEGILIIRRSLSVSGQSKIYVNDILISVSTLSNIGNYLVQICGQNNQKGLLNESMHRDILDKAANLSDLVEEVKKSYQEYDILRKKLLELKDNEFKLKQEYEYINHVIEEIESLEILDDEEITLSNQRKALMDKDEICTQINQVKTKLQDYPAIDDQIREAQLIIIKNDKLSSRFENVVESLERALIEIGEANNQLNDFNEEDEFQGNLEQIEERLFAIRGLARKYKVNSADLNNYAVSLKEKRKLMQDPTQIIENLENELKVKDEEYFKLACKLRSLRQEYAVEFENKLHEQLKPLKMDRSKFKVKLEDIGSYGLYGVDKVTFLVSTNPGMPLGSLNKIASGGELSRFMLACQLVLTNSSNDNITMIFDEVDTGIGGAVADAVGKRLKILSKNAQILVITHQPQVAAKSDSHYKVSKIQHENHTVSNIEKLDKKAKLQEIARMLSGEVITDQAISAAKQIMV